MAITNIILPFLASITLFSTLAQCYLTNNLTDDLWNSPESNSLKLQAYESTFVKGVVNGNLDPDQYAHYMIQDAYWVLEMGNFWQIVSTISNTSNLEFATGRAKSWRTYGQEMLDDYSLHKNGIEVGNAARSYLMTVNESIAVQPAYMLVSSYPCAKLWPYLQERCRNDSRPGNVYQQWCNADPSTSLIKQEELINMYYNQGIVHKNEAKKYFKRGMEGEVNFFNKGVRPDNASYLLVKAA